jgi:FtsH-binding integral membrane protein
VAERAVGLRDVLLLSGACVVVVLGAAIVTGFLPADAQSVVFKTPLLIVILILGTAAALWRIARPRPETAEAASAAPSDEVGEPLDPPDA